MASLKKYTPLFIFVVAFSVAIIFTNTFLTSANEASRIGTIKSLERTGGWGLDNEEYIYAQIGNNKVFYTWDIVRRGGHLYTSKPPVFTWLSWKIKEIIPFDFPGSPKDFNLAYYFLTLATVGLSYSLLLVFFYKSLLLAKVKLKVGLLVTFLLGLATIILPFATVYNNHLPAALFLYLAFYFYLRGKIKRNHKFNLILIGLFLSLVAVFELTIGLFFWLFFLIYLIFSKNKAFYYFLIGSFPILALHFYLNWQITGDLMPAYLHTSWYLFREIDPGLNSFLGRTKYLFKLLILPAKGFLFYNPIIIVAFYAVYKIIKERKELYKEAVFSSFCFILSLLVWLFFTYDAGGSSYGLRWAIPYLPIFMFFLGSYLNQHLIKRNHLFIILALFSFSLALVGLLNPWTVEFNGQLFGLDFPLLYNLHLLIE